MLNLLEENLVQFNMTDIQTGTPHEHKLPCVVSAKKSKTPTTVLSACTGKCLLCLNGIVMPLHNTSSNQNFKVPFGVATKAAVIETVI